MKGAGDRWTEHWGKVAKGKVVIDEKMAKRVGNGLQKSKVESVDRSSQETSIRSARRECASGLHVSCGKQ